MYLIYALTVFLFLLNDSKAQDNDYVEGYFHQKIDHFNFLSHGDQTYKQRFLYNASWWDKGKGPIFFYAGNEGDIVGLWNNNRFVIEAAQAFNALVVFVEHRYYGKSLPFGSDSFKSNNIGYLSVDQALSDYAFFIKSYKKILKIEKLPVIAFGGSYGGMLVAYMRFKYPNVIHGAISASAPIYQGAGKTSGDLFFQVVSKDFSDVSPQCEKQVRAAFSQLAKWAALGPPGYSEISRTFHLCKPLESDQDYQHFLRWIRNAFVNAAMLDYPYPSSSFLASFPAYPVKTMCHLLQSSESSVDGLYKATALNYNETGSLDCFDIYQEYIYCADPTGCGLGFDSTAWDYQTCTEINLEGGTNGETDMFPALPFNAEMRDEYCYTTYKVLPRRDYMDVQFWGEDISSASNIVFSNGNLDPWAPGGVLKNISDSVVAIMIDGGAHHLDFKGDNPNDPPSVKFAREFELRNIQKWLEEFYRK